MTIPSRHRWYRFAFRLRTLIVLFTLIAVLTAWIANERRQSRTERAISEQLRKEGFGAVDFAGPYDSLETIYSRKRQGWWRDFARQILGERVVEIRMASTNVDDLAPVAALSNLQKLDIGLTHLNDLSPLAHLTTLGEIFLDETQVTDLSPLAGLTNLKCLDVRVTPVSDISPLRSLTNLESLDLRNTQITDEQVAALQQALPNCKIER